MDWLDTLKTIALPPAEVRRVQSWEEIEAALGLPLPADYKAFAETYGAVSVGDFFHVYSPFTRNKNLDLVSGVKSAGEAFAILHDHHPIGYPLPPFPEPGSFMAWSVTDNGDYFGWIVEGAPADNWKVAVMDDEKGEPQRFDLGFGTFLLGVVTGEVRPEAFPTGFGAEEWPLKVVPVP